MYRRFIYLIMFSLVFSQTTGKISGIVKDKSDSSSLPGANVYLETPRSGLLQMNKADLH